MANASYRTQATSMAHCPMWWSSGQYSRVPGDSVLGIYGEDYEFFHLPSINPQYGQPLLSEGMICGMFNDRPEVREVMRYLTTGESTKEFVKENLFLSAHRDTPLEWYTSSRGLRYAQILFGAETFRLKASDQMPSEVTVRFWRGISEWIAGRDLDTILHEIDESWLDKE